MDYKFVETVMRITINGHEFTIDAGELETAKKGKDLAVISYAAPESEDGLAEVRRAIDDLLGEGALERVMVGQPNINDLQIRRLAATLGGAVNKRRVDLLVEAFKEVSETGGNEAVIQ